MSATRGKTICFIDNGNIFYGQQTAGWRIDWQKFLQYLEQDSQIWQTYYFASQQDPPRDEETAFYTFLKEELRWEVSIYALGKRTITCSKCRHTKTVPVEKGVDVGLATKMLMLGMNQSYETAILVSGDRDYLETVKFLKGLGIRVEIVAWQNALSEELSAESSAPVLFFDDIRNRIEKA